MMLCSAALRIGVVSVPREILALVVAIAVVGLAGLAAGGGYAFPLAGLLVFAAALSGSYALSLATLLILAIARGEMPYGTALAVGPRAAWNRLRMPSESRSSS